MHNHQCNTQTENESSKYLTKRKLHRQQSANAIFRSKTKMRFKSSSGLKSTSAYLQ